MGTGFTNIKLSLHKVVEARTTFPMASVLREKAQQVGGTSVHWQSRGPGQWPRIAFHGDNLCPTLPTAGK
jgi:hypothetical protein